MFQLETKGTAMCPCESHRRHLEEADPQNDDEIWEIVYTCVIVFAMFAGLISDRIGADHVMLIAMTMFMVSGIITVREGLDGFANRGLLTVIILFVVAEGISKTGALDWYMGKLLGSPKSIASAQLRIMIPITIVSAFLNNTPIVVVMLPIIQRWAKNNRLPKQQLLIPLSFASIFGGTCTLIGTSTNLVVTGLLEERYQNEVTIGLFDLGLYGVPVAMAGIAFVILLSPYLLPGEIEEAGDEDAILLGARVTAWSPAAGRTVQRSGLRDTGGIFLVSVHRANTGNVHRAVSRDFVLNPGDTLYFTGLVESFGEFCEEHGLEMVTNESQPQSPGTPTEFTRTALPALEEEDNTVGDLTGLHVGVTKESLLKADEEERLRSIHRMTDLIRGTQDADPDMQGAPANIVVSMDGDLVVVGINAQDRPGLLLDISKGLLRLGTETHRSSCQWKSADDLPDLEQIWSVLNALLSNEGGVAKQRGLRVIRAKVQKGSRLEGKMASEIDFKQLYKAALVVDPTSRLKEGDVVVLQAKEDSPLLVDPPADFYKMIEDLSVSKSTSVLSLVSLVSRRGNRSTTELDQTDPKQHGSGISSDNSDGDTRHHQSDVENAAGLQELEAAWKDLQVLTPQAEEAREFLTAMAVAKKSKFAGKTANQLGINKLPGVYLVTIDRPTTTGATKVKMQGGKSSMSDALSQGEKSLPDASSIAITQDEPLREGDILWFSGSATSVGDLRKIPGLRSHESEEIGKIKEKVFDRRLVQAVVARKGALVGRTVKEMRFRSRYGAAVIAVHREGKRVHDHPGQVKLQAGDVLLLEAGPSFISKSAEHDRSFALLSEVQDSAPPRLSLLVPALLITAAMLAVFTAGVAELVVCGLVASFLMVAIGIMSEQEARDAVNWEIYVTIASAFGIGKALMNSGVADIVANFLVDVGAALGIGDAGLLGAVYFATFLISSVVTNNAAAALLFPIAMNAAENTGTDRLLMSYSLMLGASASFMTPFGYQTNLLIYGPGGYKYSDFLKFGTPLQLVLWVLSIVFLSVLKWYISWIASAIALAAAIAFRLIGASSARKSARK